MGKAEKFSCGGVCMCGWVGAQTTLLTSYRRAINICQRKSFGQTGRKYKIHVFSEMLHLHKLSVSSKQRSCSWHIPHSSVVPSGSLDLLEFTPGRWSHGWGTIHARHVPKFKEHWHDTVSASLSQVIAIVTAATSLAQDSKPNTFPCLKQTMLKLELPHFYC